MKIDFVLYYYDTKYCLFFSIYLYKNVIFHILQLYQYYLDKWTPFTASRWVFTLIVICGFLLRVFLKQGWYIVCYGLGIYHLNQFLAFLTPKIDPAFSSDDG